MTYDSRNVMAVPPSSPLITTIEWEMLDKHRFYPLSMMSSFTVRCFLYPLTLIRTRLQVQHQTAIYSGTIDAFRQISRSEGFRGLYRGFWVSAFQVVSGVCYVSTYELVRHRLERSGVRDTKVKALCGGSAASVVGQTVIVPFDVISQHVMVLGLTANASNKSPFLIASPLAIDVTGKTKAQVTRTIIRTIYQRDGPRGFYRGYLAALCNYVPSSACWWGFYSAYQEAFTALNSPLPHTAVQCGAAVLSGCTTSLLTNPLDLIRTRVQVQQKTIPDTFRILWEQEGVNIFKKGLTARMTSSCIYSIAIIFGYETVKKACVLPEYKERVRW